MTNSFGDDDRDNESGHVSVRPNGWEAAWEAAQDELAPSAEIKKAAETLVWCEVLQQSMGWLLLTQIGILLGSFGQVMSQGVCLLSWGIFTLEAILKYGRSWAHNHYFRDVPCVYVPMHHDAAHNSLAFFGLFVLSATLLEVSLYVPFIYSCVRFWLHHRKCYDNEDDVDCPDGTTRLIEMLIVSIVIVCLHWIASLGTVLAFKAAMGMGITALTQRSRKSQMEKQHSSISKTLERFSTKRTASDRVLCLAWWVHMARHRHLSSVVASAKHDDCGLPGHWFESVSELKSIVEKCDMGGHVHLDPSGPLCVSQEMALRALVSLAKQSNEQISTEILSENGFLRLVQVVGEGTRETCRGLAAAAIAVLATQSAVLEQNNVDLTTAVVPLKRLARSMNVEHTEVAYAALLNASLNEKQSSEVISKLLSGDGMAIGEDESGSNFVSSIIDHAHRSHTTRCQELAVGLLSCLVGDRKGKPARVAMATDIGRRVNGLQLCTALLRHGLTAQIQAAAAGVLAELAYWKDGQVLSSGHHSEGYIEALVNGLQKEPSIAFASARALCSLAYKHQENKVRIVQAGAIKHLVDLLGDRGSSSQQKLASFGRRDVKKPRLQRLGSTVSLEALRKIDEVDGSSHTNASNVRRDSEMSQLEERIRSDAARALRILALNNPQHQQLIVAAGAIPLLVNLLFTPNPKVHVQAIPALSALSWRNRTNQDLIGEYEGGKAFAGLAYALDKADEAMADVILEKVGQMTMSLAEGNESNRQNLLRQGIIRRTLEDRSGKAGPSNKSNAKAIQNAKKALEFLDKEQPT